MSRLAHRLVSAIPGNAIDCVGGLRTSRCYFSRTFFTSSNIGFRTLLEVPCFLYSAIASFINLPDPSKLISNEDAYMANTTLGEGHLNHESSEKSHQSSSFCIAIRCG